MPKLEITPKNTSLHRAVESRNQPTDPSWVGGNGTKGTNVMSLNVNIRESSGVSVVDLAGQVTIGDSAGTLRETLRQLADSGRLQVLLNLADVSSIDSSGIGLLVTSFATFYRLGGKLKLVNLNGRVQD